MGRQDAETSGASVVTDKPEEPTLPLFGMPIKVNAYIPPGEVWIVNDEANFPLEKATRLERICRLTRIKWLRCWAFRQSHIRTVTRIRGLFEERP